MKKNKSIRLPEISRQPVQKLTTPPIATPALIYIYPHLALFTLTKHEIRFVFLKMLEIA